MPMLNGNVTRIEDLPELSDMENSFGGMNEQHQPNFSKYIRNHSRETYQNSGVNQKNQQMYQYNNQYNNQESNDYSNNIPQPEPQIVYHKEMYEPTPAPLNCLDVCNHIKDCPLCSKFYHNDNTIYIIIIISLLILTIILTKKVLNV